MNTLSKLIEQDDTTTENQSTESNENIRLRSKIKMLLSFTNGIKFVLTSGGLLVGCKRKLWIIAHQIEEYINTLIDKFDNLDDNLKRKAVVLLSKAINQLKEEVIKCLQTN